MSGAGDDAVDEDAKLLMVMNELVRLGLVTLRCRDGMERLARLPLVAEAYKAADADERIVVDLAALDAVELRGDLPPRLALLLDRVGRRLTWDELDEVGR